MRPFPVLIAIAVAAAVIALGSGPASAATVEVDTGDFYFCSSEYANDVCPTAITAGDTITWTVSSGLHTVTECDDSHTTCPPSGGGFDSGTLREGDTYSLTFDTAGTYYYYCAFHPIRMLGQITVQEATPAPTAEPTQTPAATDGGNATQTATPAAAPKTGGPPGAGGGGPTLLLLGLGGALIVAGAGALFASRRGVG